MVPWQAVTWVEAWMRLSCVKKVAMRDLACTECLCTCSERQSSPVSAVAVGLCKVGCPGKRFLSQAVVKEVSQWPKTDVQGGEPWPCVTDDSKEHAWSGHHNARYVSTTEIQACNMVGCVVDLWCTLEATST